MTTNQFLHDLRAFLRNGSISQMEISKRSHVSQGTISKIVNGKKSILLSTTIKLWPVVYGCAFPHQCSNRPSTATPTTPPGGEGGAGELETAQEGRDA